MKNSLKEIKGRSEQTGEREGKLEDRTVKIIKSEKQTKRPKESEQSRGACGHHQEDQIGTVAVQREESKKRLERISDKIYEYEHPGRLVKSSKMSSKRPALDTLYLRHFCGKTKRLLKADEKRDSSHTHFLSEIIGRSLIRSFGGQSISLVY